MSPPALIFLMTLLLGGASTSPAPEVRPDTWSGRAGECAYSVSSWDFGERSDVTGRYGDNAEAFVESCRLFLESLD